jgi:hypothetical protein
MSGRPESVSEDPLSDSTDWEISEELVLALRGEQRSTKGLLFSADLADALSPEFYNFSVVVAPLSSSTAHAAQAAH